MQNGVEGTPAEGLGQRGAIVATAGDEHDVLRQRLAMPLRKIIQHHDLVTTVAQGEHGVAANIAGAAGHQVSGQVDPPASAATMRRIPYPRGKPNISSRLRLIVR
jgi:hypothetical protein